MTDGIFLKYMQCGGGDVLGNPKQPEQVVVSQDGLVGCYRDFDNGSIYWTAETKACFIAGRILDEWRIRGAQNSELGYPIEDQRENHNIFYCRFQRGVIYYSLDRDLCKVHINGKNPSLLWRRIAIAAVFVAFIFGAIYVNLANCAVKYGIAMGESSCNMWNGGILPTIILLLAPIAATLLRFAWPTNSDTNFEHDHF